VSVYDNEPDPDAEPPEPVSAGVPGVGGVSFVVLLTFVTCIVWASGGRFVP
jgi:hypothetical protein